MEAPRTEETAAGERLISRTVRIPTPDFRAAVGAMERPRTVWSAPDEPTVVGGGAAATVTGSGPDRFVQVREAAAGLFEGADVATEHRPARPRLFGGFAFTHGGGEGRPWTAFPEARFVVPRVQVTIDDDTAWLTVTATGREATGRVVEARLDRARERFEKLPGPGPVAAAPGIVDRTRTTARDDWTASVSAAVERIRRGDLRKVVLAQALEVSLATDLSIPDVLARLGDRYPDCYRFLVEPTEGTAGFFGATPERLVSLRGRTVETGALAGTTGRGETPAEDEWLASELAESEKNVHEHELVAEAIRDQLHPLATSVSTGERTVRRLATVQHLWTPITAELASDEHVLSLVEALHPTPAVGGLPPDDALRTIRETEPFDRGWYAAPVGWFDAEGAGSFAVALRSGVARDRTVTLFAGVGIVADSDPDREWDEVQLKYRPILDELE
jgi:menaquinone-specific isochorismate synthase